METFRRFVEWGCEMGSCACLSGASSIIVPPPQMSYTLGCLRFRPWPAALLPCSGATTCSTERATLAGGWLHIQVEEKHIAGTMQTEVSKAWQKVWELAAGHCRTQNVAKVSAD